MELEKLISLLNNEKPFRLKQAEKAIYTDMSDSWQKVTALPQKIRDMLDREMPFDFDFTTIKSMKNNTLKALIRLQDGLLVETVLLRHKDSRNTVCVSSQAGCPMGCIFCRTAGAGYKRNLLPLEIAVQVLFFKYYLKNTKNSVTNIVFMGMGEPFLNYANVIEAVRILNDKNRFNIGARKISISTCGIPYAIEKLADENIQVNLAVSLNAPDDLLRSKIMPVNLKYPLGMLVAAIKKYISKTNRRVMFEYILLEGINDSKAHALELAGLLKGLLCFVNLIPFNGSGELRPPEPDVIKQFIKVLEEEGISVTRRYSFGRDINAACGQLVYSDCRQLKTGI